MAFTFTGDMGCEFGPSTTTSAGVYLQGVGCHGNTKDAKSVGGDYFAAGINPKQSFLGYMLYNRFWFKKDRYALTVGGGQINNPGRYLVLIPPINGETAASAAINSPYFTGNPSDPFKAWDSSVTFDYMPRQYITFRWEYDYRHASVPYWSGPGGITPPGSGGVPYTNNGYPQFYACNNGNSSMTGNLTARGNGVRQPGRRAAYGSPICGGMSSSSTWLSWSSSNAEGICDAGRDFSCGNDSVFCDFARLRGFLRARALRGI